MKRDGQFYVFDAFFAATILFLGIGFLVMEFSAVPDQSQTQALTFDIAQSMSANVLEDIFTNYTLENQDILDGSKTPAQQIQTWWHNQSCTTCMSNATALTESLLQAMDYERYGVNVSIHNDTRSTTFFTSQIPVESRLMIVNQQIVITETLGPDTLEVRVWQ